MKFAPERVTFEEFLQDLQQELAQPHEKFTSVHEAYAPLCRAMHDFHSHASLYSKPEQAYLTLVKVAAMAYQAAHDLRFIGAARPGRDETLSQFELRLVRDAARLVDRLTAAKQIAIFSKLAELRTPEEEAHIERLERLQMDAIRRLHRREYSAS